MTISSEVLRSDPIQGDGLTTTFPFSMPVSSSSDIEVVEQVIATGVDTIKTLTTDYTVTLSGAPAGSTGGTVTFLSAPAATVQISTYLKPGLKQETSFPLAGDFLSTSVESALDKLTNMVKRTRDLANRSLTLNDGDSDGSGTFDANSNKITNLGTGTASTDAATIANVDAKVASAVLSPSGATLISALGAGYRLQDTHYQITATSSVARDLEARLGEWFSVKDFGAVGDGSTDDTTKIQAALTAAKTATVGVVVIPPGTYVTSAALSVASGITILGYGATLSLANASDVNVLEGETGADDVNVIGLSIDGNRSNQTTAVHGMYFVGTSLSANRIRVKDCRVIQCRGSGIQATGCKDVQIRDTWIDDTGNEGIDLLGDLEHSSISGCHVSETDQAGISINGIAYYVSITGNICENNGGGGDSITAYNAANEHLIVANNVCRNPTNHAMHLGGSDIVVTGNEILNPTFDGIYIENHTATTADGVTITGNRVQQARYGVHVNDATNGTIGSNSIQGCTSGMNIEDAQDFAITGNTSRGNSDKGLRIAGTIDSTISGNVLTENTSHGIEMRDGTAGSLSNAVTGNVIKDNGGFGILASGAEANNLIKGNSLFNNTSGDLSILNATTNAEDNFSDDTTLPTVAAATSITLPGNGDTINVTDSGGPTTINTIVAPWLRRRVTLLFPITVATVVGDGAGNIQLNGSFTATATHQDALELVYNGANWTEVSRSNN